MFKPTASDLDPSPGPGTPLDSVASSKVEFAAGAGRRPYSKPGLADYGRLRDVTLGGSSQVGDSGGALAQPTP